MRRADNVEHSAYRKERNDVNSPHIYSQRKMLWIQATQG